MGTSKRIYASTRWLGPTKASWADWAGRVRTGLAGDGGSGREVMARPRQLNSTFYFLYINFFIKALGIDISVLSVMYSLALV